MSLGLRKGQLGLALLSIPQIKRKEERERELEFEKVVG